MKKSEEIALDFLVSKISLSKVSGDPEEICDPAFIYDGSLKNCDLFSFNMYHQTEIDGGRYVAVPRDGRGPFYVNGRGG